MHGEAKNKGAVDREDSRPAGGMPSRRRYSPPKIEKGRKLSEVSGAQASGAPAPLAD